MAKRHYIPITSDVPGVSDSKCAFIRKVIRTALTEQGVNVPCEVDVYVTGDAGIQELNREMLKRISSLARRDIEKFMGTKVYMETWVKVKENWRDNVNFIRSQGYNEE